MESKTCTKCGEEKLLSDFGWQKKSKGRRHPRCKSCRCADAKAWVESHRDVVCERRRGYSERSAGRNKERAKKWYWENRDRALANVKSRRRRLSETSPEWQASERDRAVQKAHRRRAQAVEAGVEPYRREDIFNRDGWRCHICSRHVARKDASIDHLIPISKGGSDAPANVRIAHLSCNISRGAGRLPAQLLLVA